MSLIFFSETAWSNEPKLEPLVLLMISSLQFPLGPGAIDF
jgi:hypothetical protein